MKKIHSYIATVAVLLASAFFSTTTCAKPPAGRDTTAEFTFDKTAPKDSYIWNRESGGDDPSDFKNNWVCLSSTSPDNGQCATQTIQEGAPGSSQGNKSSIPLLFREKKSGATTIINLTAYRNVGGYGPWVINAAAHASSGNNGADATFYVPKQEIAKFPFGGNWQAELKVSLIDHYAGDVKAADWVAHISLKITDNNNQQIYLPEFGQAAPRVDLNMRPLPGTGGNQAQMTGRANIDMCLYDGYGSNSSSFTLKFEDQPQGSSSPSSGNFFIYTDHGDVNQSSGWIEYFVQMVLPDGNKMSIMRGHDIVIPDIQNAHVRPVHLPGIPQAVLCVPMPIELNTKAIDINSKQAGHYTGHLIVTFTSQL
ncbi:alpha-fimbriae tip adhesin [Rahnella aquatilis CIP 78.65 = ATCC 33071]|uniref:CblD like pilus biogenesis initiator n=1 Tax=Rahnella aquatilis (strain ATCC 33071 / DSM 4594 / JCM 1683 / NBRC 105701 / NCIMB 13365 / CIP 78.65) TaxID=745277 RepID=H2J134_RAHAC|nr:CfaE/CblD family pilus tip adhesin [Rahnella aquatilis]AEX53412.1 CblD like pilus biogenesis initiator [Rahnella aquatilis CIP 78.65 = ATCC 33071]KFD03525.1 alpha-fimbriae tip adhesin [Rahnella aquatilis CIP 78.65 = ATCC 33071]